MGELLPRMYSAWVWSNYGPGPQRDGSGSAAGKTPVERQTSTTALAYLLRADAFSLFSATASRTSALNAFSSSLSPS